MKVRAKSEWIYISILSSFIRFSMACDWRDLRSATDEMLGSVKRALLRMVWGNIFEVWRVKWTRGVNAFLIPDSECAVQSIMPAIPVSATALVAKFTCGFMDWKTRSDEWTEDHTPCEINSVRTKRGARLLLWEGWWPGGVAENSRCCLLLAYRCSEYT